jgi:hypothetical protein
MYIKKLLPCIKNYIKIIADLTVILGMIGIIFGALTYYQYKDSEKKKYAIEAINKVYNRDFLNCYNKLNLTDSTIENMNEEKIFVINTYYVIAVIYNNGIADKNIIKYAIKYGVDTVSKALFYKDTTLFFARLEIDKMKNDFKTK